MSLTEFMADASLGTPSWIEDDFDITSTLSSPNSMNNLSLSNSSNYRFDRFDRNSRFNTSSLSGSQYIVVFDNVPSYCTRQLLKELFESRYTRFIKCHVLIDPSDESKKRKLAFVFLHNNQDLQKVCKWNGFNIERNKIFVEPIPITEFNSIMEYNRSINYDEDEEDERIENAERERRERHNNKTPDVDHHERPPIRTMPKANPFGAAKPVTVPEIPVVSENTREVAQILQKKKAKEIGRAHV